MSKDISKEALFNEIKGSIFEYLVARDLARLFEMEDEFIRSIPSDYLKVLISQDLMIRKFYPTMQVQILKAAKESSERISQHIKMTPLKIRLIGKYSMESETSDVGEGDIVLIFKDHLLPISLKLNKKNAFVNTKSGGIKSFFHQYFPWIDQKVQLEFNKFVDQEFENLAFELHSYHDLEFRGDFKNWVRCGFSELPGELGSEEREIVKKYYARIAFRMHEIFSIYFLRSNENFFLSTLSLMGFTDSRILQVICYHDFQHDGINEIFLSSLASLNIKQDSIQIRPFHQTASVEISLGDLLLHLRVKPMNKFTTTAIKINCAIKLPKNF